MSRLRLSVATKIALSFAVVLVTFASVGVTSIVSLHWLGKDLGVVGESYLPLTKSLAQIESLHKNKERDTDRVLHEHDRSTERILVSNTRNYFGKMMQDRVRAARAVLLRAQGQARRQDAAFFGDMERRLSNLSDRYGEYSAAAGALYDALSVDIPNETEVAKRSADLRRLEAAAGREVSFLSTELETQIAARVNQVHRAEVRAAWVIIALSLGAIGLGLLATGLSQRLLLPIQLLTEEVKGISRGDFARRVELTSNDEVGALAQAFNGMAASLAERERQLFEQRERLLRSERLAAIGQVSAQITHEIRNPLSSIGLNAELLADELRDAHFTRPAQRTEAGALLSAIAREIDRLTEISEQYLAFARAPRSPPAPVDLGELCRDLLDFLAAELAAAGVTTQLSLPDDLPLVTGNEDQLRQALLNLLRNAKEAMAGDRPSDRGSDPSATGATGGALANPLWVRASWSAAEGVRLEVSDSGPGVPLSVRERIFDPFFSTKLTGTGLGLSLSQRIAQEHGGSLRLQANTQAAEGGATFVLSFPPNSLVHPDALPACAEAIVPARPTARAHPET